MDRAEEQGKKPDSAMAIELSNAFGQPAEVAARYRPVLTIIDPTDGRRFVRATVIGLAIIWGLGLTSYMVHQPIESVGEFFLALGRWWGGTLLRSLWWPGLLVMGFWAASWLRSQPSKIQKWKPSAVVSNYTNRAGMILGLIGLLCGTFVIKDPAGALELMLGERAAPAALEAFTYADAFRQLQAPILLGLLGLSALLMIVAIVRGTLSPLQRRIEIGLSLVTCAVLIWALVAGPLFVAEPTDQLAKLLIGAIVLFMLVKIALDLYRVVRPAPSPAIATK